MRLRPVLALSALFVTLGSFAAAHADTLSTFTFSGVLDPNTGTGGTVSGSLVIDTTTGTFVSSDLTSVYGSTPYTVSPTETTFHTTNGSLVILSFGSSAEPQDAVVSFVLPTTTLVNYGGGSICTDIARCTQGPSNYTSSYFAPGATFGDGFTSGRLSLVVPPTAPAATVAPEPSSIALLGTGLLGTAGVLRRRLQPAQA